MKKLKSIGALLAALNLAGCVVPGTVTIGEPRPSGPVVVRQPYPHGATAQPNVPPGHLPPPGKCRVWYPDRPPGQQPPPGDCHSLQYQVPPGAHLIRR